MGVKILLFFVLVAGSLFITGCNTNNDEKSLQGKPLIYIVEEPKEKVFVVEGENGLGWFEETKSQRNEMNTIRSVREDEEEQEEFEIKNKLKNVVRSIDNEFIIGYDEEIDDPKWKEVE